MEVLGRTVLLPLALAFLVAVLVQSLGTPRGCSGWWTTTCVRLAHQVLRLLAALESVGGTALERGDRTLVGTLPHLVEDPARAQLYKQGLRHVAVSPADAEIPVASRRLELLLDRISWTASRAADGRGRYLLDARDEGLPWTFRGPGPPAAVV